MSERTLLGILGGTFDPVHAGHLRVALELYEQGPFARIHFVPCDTPVHRDPPLFDADTRLALLRVATEGQPGMVVDDREIKRTEPSYMVHTLQSLKTEYPEHPLCLILGIDAFCEFDQWHQWSEIFELAHLVVVDRPGYKLPEKGRIAEILATRQVDDYTQLQSTPAGKILCQAPVFLDISSTHLRACLAREQSIRYLVPDSVWATLQNPV